ncbi:DUF1566 domain-containing protein [Seleniivibrio woodruffii]|uniref:Lcl domain-containing protein n=1 Tax=Seleniivibrio woodruffii TaxID=1078050 RepID=UPI0026F011AE|nr:DUF1566 domain-containing protein [Seleniivibrio woodruffii]
MRLIYMVIIALVFMLFGCFNQNISSSSSETPNSEIVYKGIEVSAVTDSAGKTAITSVLLGIVYEIVALSDDGQPVSGVKLSYTESGGKSVVYVSDNSGRYADIVLVGTPSELAARYPRSRTAEYRSERATSYNLGVVLKQGKGHPTGFGTDAQNLNSVYMGTSERTGDGWTTDCYAADGISDFISGVQGLKVFIFGGLTANDNIYMEIGGSWTGEALTAAMTQKLAEVYGMSYANAALASYQMTCYTPSDEMNGLGAVCEIVKSNDVCQTTPGGGEETPTNTAPTIAGVPTYTIAEGAGYSFIPTADDADDDALTFSITGKPDWASFDTATGALTGTAVTGIYTGITISVSDGTDTVSLAPFTITVAEVVPPNTPPTVDGTPITAVYRNALYSFTPTGADADNDTLTFSIAGKPDWATFNQSTGALTGTAEVGTFENIVITVSDGMDTASLPAFTITVTNRAPSISGTPTASAQTGANYSFTPSGSDADGDTLTYSIANKPSWASFNTSTGALSGTTTAGTFTNIVISVSDGVATTSLTEFSIAVEDPNFAPTILGTPTVSLYVNTAYSFEPDADDANGDTLTFSIENKPDWATFSETTGALTGTPTQTGTWSNIVISVSDGTANVSLAPFDIAVQNHAPDISGTPATVKNGEELSFTPTASDADGDTLEYSISGNPVWMSINSSTGTVSGTAVLGTYEDITITVRDGRDGGVSTLAFDLTVHYPWILAKTGQTISYSANDDGAYGMGVAPSFSRDSATGTVTDGLNGLMWQDNEVGTAMDWTTAGTTCDNLSLGGYTDWRLPTIEELESIVDFGRFAPAINSVFTSVSPYAGYWSSTAHAFFAGNEWYISFDSGAVSADNVDSYVRCVRGNAYPAADFARDDTNNIVTDNRTGLMWQDDEVSSAITWEDAITYCEDKSLGGYTDWRLPNQRELSSIVDRSTRNPSINPAFTLTAVNHYWSSTTYKFLTTYALISDFSYGSTNMYPKTYLYYARCVRGG